MKTTKCFVYYEVKLITPDGYAAAGRVCDTLAEINKWLKPYKSNLDYRGYFVNTARVVQERIA